ncbi:hypothetical protein AURDEDRAFT_114544 [Auricularia subglabra TFB-10046 SS5]|nr:hypothetical protein AURDEDRAFT_114544 [Auricularia subglabra TFB-10046 SS5]
MGMQFGDEPRAGSKRRRESGANRVREPVIREDPARIHHEKLQALVHSGQALWADPAAHPDFVLRLYPKSLERAALLSQINYEESYALECARMSWEEERDKVESEWRKGLDRVRERLLEGVEERRKRAREEKDGEGIIVDSSLDGNSRPHLTRKTRNKPGAPSPPPPEKVPAPNVNPNSLAVEEIPSPFPLTLTDVTLTSASAGAKRTKKGGAQIQAVGLGKAIQQITSLKDSEIDSDLGEIRRATKKRRAVAAAGLARG